jgi:hypothetical protein
MMDSDQISELLKGRRRFVPPGIAVALLPFSRAETYRQISEGRLETFDFLGARFVYVSSIVEARERWLRRHKPAETSRQAVHIASALLHRVS